MIVAIDVGLKRIGVAISLEGKIAIPSTPILRKNRNQAARDVSDMLKEKGAKILVVGLPKGGSSETEMERRIKHFISLLEFDGEICYQDESYSSVEASELVSNKRDGKFDSIAAMIILERFLNR
ncbi:MULTISPECIES: Holliday junction resolvase RuvX [Campylobacter]|uniref:Holliday junction resolvase RuvX n=1 Tax=Campylobacter TaxID=194 RepID=UPI000A35A0BE|nr:MULTISPECIES: Holliday junction resolvase RuvX [unclassified Campylobacter]MCR8695864.1 Holliday junction resolvase RuvX [Campylobacter sp. RM19073]